MAVGIDTWGGHFTITSRRNQLVYPSVGCNNHLLYRLLVSVEKLQVAPYRK